MAPTVKSKRHRNKFLATFLMPTASLHNFIMFATTLSTVVKQRDKPMITTSQSL